MTRRRQASDHWRRIAREDALIARRYRERLWLERLIWITFPVLLISAISAAPAQSRIPLYGIAGICYLLFVYHSITRKVRSRSSRNEDEGD